MQPQPITSRRRKNTATSLDSIKLTERHIQKQCEDLLVLDAWRIFRLEQNFSERKRKVVGESGAPDGFYVRYGIGVVPWCVDAMFIEWKTRTGRAEAHQIAWHTAERARGALVLLAGVDFPAHFQGFTQFYARSGLLRRKGLC